MVLVGHRGWHSTDLYSRILEFGIPNGVRYLGYVDSSSLPTIFAGARALIFPSIYEGFGLPVLEAMQCGTVRLTSPDSAMSEISRDAALLTDLLNIEEMAVNIKELANNDTMVIELQKKGEARSVGFSWQRCANQT